MPETRYATTADGLAIAYQVLGRGPPNFVWVPGFASATVPSLVVGSGLAFERRGELALAGAEGTWPLLALVRPTAARP